MSRTFARWLLTKFLAAERRDAIVGDLEEDYARGGSDARYWKETVVTIAHEIARVNLADIAWPLGLGAAGAAVQIWIVLLHVQGPIVMFAYPAVMVTAAVYVHGRYPSSFAARFAAVLSAFMCMTVIFYFALYGVIAPRSVGNIALPGHLFRLAAMLAIGSGAAGAIALLVRIPDADPRRFVVATSALGTGAMFVLAYGGWTGFGTACASVFLAAALYIYLRRLAGFAQRYLVVAVPFVSSLVLFTTIHQLSGHVSAHYRWPRLAVFVVSGCALAALIARLTPARAAVSKP